MLMLTEHYWRQSWLMESTIGFSVCPYVIVYSSAATILSLPTFSHTHTYTRTRTRARTRIHCFILPWCRRNKNQVSSVLRQTLCQRLYKHSNYVSKYVSEVGIGIVSVYWPHGYTWYNVQHIRGLPTAQVTKWYYFSAAVH